MNITELLADLKDTYVMLKPSPVHGIGVFAIRDIPKGCRSMFSIDNGEWIKVPITEIEALPPESKDLVETYCLYDEENYYVPSYGFKKMDLINYLNHSAQPNVRSVNDGEFFEAITAIPAGQELLVNYEDIVKVEGY